ncbi:unnamed protein product [Ceutorhynchus assimilis]|uniref:Uncharacterized protein n=1 Tax=Ceutorhynchus assimilis TaxID=467358 RepID=A0A9N9MGY4_9CUCU|nr:unnamed protein product [Ceutorhynchus assimilis]
MSAQHHANQTLRPNRISPSLSTDRYYFVSPNTTGTNIAFSDLLARDSGNYESVTDIDLNFSKGVTRNSALNTCERCFREIGNKAFCYNCFGPAKMPLPKKSSKKHIALWIFVAVIIPLMVFMCLSMCLMHLYKIGLYRDDDVAQLKKDMKIALTEIRYLSSYTDGFTNTFNRNMSHIFSNIAKLKIQVAKNKSVWPKQIVNMQEIFNVSCQEYLKLHNTTKIINICHSVFNGTYFK